MFMHKPQFKIISNIARIVRKLIRGKYKYYIQLIMEGIPPIKCKQRNW